MRKRYIRLLTFSLALLLAFSLLAGCGSGGQEQETAGDSKNSAEQTEGTGGNVSEDLSSMEPVEFTIFHHDPSVQPPAEDAPVFQKVFELTKVKVKFEIPPSSAVDRLNIMLASGEYPDAIMFSEENINIRNKFIAANAIIPIDELMAKYAPNLVENLGEHAAKAKYSDGKIYYIPKAVNGEWKVAYVESERGFMYLSGFLESKDWFSPKTYDDFYGIVKEFKQKNPDKIGVSFAFGNTENIDHLIYSNMGSNGLQAYSNIHRKADGSLEYYIRPQQNKQFLQLLNKMYGEGLVDKESIVLTDDMLKAKMGRGDVFCTIGNYWVHSFEANSMLGEANETQRYVQTFPKANEGVSKLTYSPVNVLSFDGTSITKSCKDPARFMKFVNFLQSEEGRLVADGITNMDGENKEGYDFYLKKEDNSIWNTTWCAEESMKDPNWASKRGVWQYLWWLMFQGNKANGQYDFMKAAEDVSTWWDDETKRINPRLTYSGTEYFRAMDAMSFDMGDFSDLPVPAESDEGIALQRANEIVFTYVPRLIFSTSENQFESLYTEMMGKIEGTGIAKWEAMINKLHKERLDTWK